MKRQLYLNKKLYEIDLLEQNKYLGNKINSSKHIIKTTFINFYSRNKLTKSSTNKKGIKFF